MKRYDQFAETLTSLDGQSYASGLPFMDYLYSGRVVYHKVKENEVNRLDLIAYKYFGDPSQWYAIALFNGLQDPISSISLGVVLAIPLDTINASTYIPFTYVGTK